MFVRFFEQNWPEIEPYADRSQTFARYVRFLVRFQYKSSVKLVRLHRSYSIESIFLKNFSRSPRCGPASAMTQEF
jgi:hypothetical protein